MFSLLSINYHLQTGAARISWKLSLRREENPLGLEVQQMALHSFAPDDYFPRLAGNHPFMSRAVFLGRRITPGSLLPHNGRIFSAQMAQPGLVPGLGSALPASPPCPECQALEGCPVLSDVLCWQSVFPLLWGRAKQAEKGPGLLHLSASWLCGFAPGAAAVCSSLKCPLMSGHKCPFEMSVCFLVSYWGST